jgi:hypothetical protein
VFQVTAVIAAPFWCLALVVVPETRDPAHAVLAHVHAHAARYAHAVTSGVDTGWIVSLLTVAVAFAIGLVCFARWYPSAPPGRSAAAAGPIRGPSTPAVTSEIRRLDETSSSVRLRAGGASASPPPADRRST